MNKRADKALVQKVASLEKTVHDLRDQFAERQLAQQRMRDQSEPTLHVEQPSTEGKPARGTRDEKTLADIRELKDPWYKSLDRWTSIAELVGIPFAILYAVVTYCQWQDLRKNFEIDQRAWIKVAHNIPISINEDMNLGGVSITLENVGKSPALRSIGDANLEVVAKDRSPALSPVPGHTQIDTSLLFPAVTSTPIGVRLYTPSLTPRILSQQELRSLIQGDTYLVSWAQIVYFDQFGKRHWTRSCIWKSYYPPGNYAADSCVAWNAVGDGNPPQK